MKTFTPRKSCDSRAGSVLRLSAAKRAAQIAATSAAEDCAKAAREANRRNAEALAKVETSHGDRTSFHFKA